MKFFNALPFAAIFVLSSLFAVVSHSEPLEPRALVELTVDEVVADMKANADVYAGNPDKLQAMVLERLGSHFNFQRMTQLAMARHWGDADNEQKVTISREFRKLLARTYANSMFDYRDVPIRVVSEQKANPRSTIVKLRIDSRSGEAVELLLRMENRNERWQVIDVVVGGISLVITYRGVFNDQISQSGIDGLITSLEQDNLDAGV